MHPTNSKAKRLSENGPRRFKWVPVLYSARNQSRDTSQDISLLISVKRPLWALVQSLAYLDIENIAIQKPTVETVLTIIQSP